MLTGLKKTHQPARRTSGQQPLGAIKAAILGRRGSLSSIMAASKRQGRRRRAARGLRRGISLQAEHGRAFISIGFCLEPGGHQEGSEISTVSMAGSDCPGVPATQSWGVGFQLFPPAGRQHCCHGAGHAGPLRGPWPDGEAGQVYQQYHGRIDKGKCGRLDRARTASGTRSIRAAPLRRDRA